MESEDFEWDDDKYQRNIEKHGIDFEDAIEMFYEPHIVCRSDRKEEERWLAVGEADGRIIAVVSRVETVEFELSLRDALGKMKHERTVIRRWGDRKKGKTDWAAVDALTDKEIEKAVRSDPDAVPLDIDWSKAVLVIPPKKKAISIRIDEDVLDYFKNGGSGYQRHMNAVLRSYMQQRRKKRA